MGKELPLFSLICTGQNHSLFSDSNGLKGKGRVGRNNHDIKEVTGAFGYFEKKPYDHGTKAIARLLASRAKGSAYGVVGGGETLQVINDLGLFDDIDFVSTGGGAMLEFLSGKELPGIKVVSKK